MQQQAAEFAEARGPADLRERFFLRRAELELKRRLPRLELRSREVLRLIHQINEPAPHQSAERSARHIQPPQSLDRGPPARSSQHFDQSKLILIKLLCRVRVVTGLWPVQPGGDARRSTDKFFGRRRVCLYTPQHRHLHHPRRIPRRRHILARNPFLPHHPAEQRLCHASRPAQTAFAHTLPFRQIVKHAKLNYLLFRPPLPSPRRPQHPRQIPRHPPLI